MSISANTLFHFTKFEYLKGILQNCFHPRHSVELLPSLGENNPVGIPMVSFCDIRITQLSKHIETYNPYGIGMRKSWGIEQGINPVFYVQQESPAYRLLSEQGEYFLNKDRFNADGDYILPKEEKPAFLNLFRLLTYYKVNFTKKYNRQTRMFEGDDINYYDEREWRYSPGQLPGDSLMRDIIPFPFVHLGLDNNDEPIMEFRDRRFANRPLRFLEDDIKYIILDKDDEVKELVDFILSNNLFPDRREILFSKINTIERIKDDH